MTPGRNNAPPPRVPQRDMVLKEGDTLTLGGETLTFYKHPGHTPGSLSAEFMVFDQDLELANSAAAFGAEVDTGISLRVAMPNANAAGMTTLRALIIIRWRWRKGRII